jgi:hypothetical protein
VRWSGANFLASLPDLDCFDCIGITPHCRKQEAQEKKAPRRGLQCRKGICSVRKFKSVNQFGDK